LSVKMRGSPGKKLPTKNVNPRLSAVGMTIQSLQGSVEGGTGTVQHKSKEGEQFSLKSLSEEQPEGTEAGVAETPKLRLSTMVAGSKMKADWDEAQLATEPHSPALKGAKMAQ
jgi:phage-related tail protein